MAEFFALLAACIEAAATELEIDLVDIHTVEATAGFLDSEWWMHINDEAFAHLRMIGDRLDVGFSAWYSEFDYLFKKQAESEVGR